MRPTSKGANATCRRPDRVLASFAAVVILAGACAGPPRGSPAAPRPIATKAAFGQVELSAVREQAHQVLAQSARHDDARVRANAIEAIGLAPARHAAAIHAALVDPSPAVRSVAAMMVGRERLRDYAGPVEALLDDSSVFAQAAAIYALTRCGTSVDRSPLADIALHDPSIRARCHAVYILGELGDPSAMELVREAARGRPERSSQAEGRLFDLQAAEALVKLGQEKQVQTLRAALYPARPEDLEATALAVQALGLIKDQGSADQLIYLAERRDEAGTSMPPEIRLGVAASLARLGIKKGDFIADEFFQAPNPLLRAQAAHVYGETGTPANLGVLRVMMADRDAMVQVAAAAAVLKIRGGGGGGV